MRIKAIVKAASNITNMANGGALAINTVSPNEEVTITKIKKDGGNSYYFIREYHGYIKKEYVKLLRDEEFYYSSELLQDTKNLAKRDLYASPLSKAGIIPDPASSVVTTSSKSSIISVGSADTTLVGDYQDVKSYGAGSITVQSEDAAKVNIITAENSAYQISATNASNSKVTAGSKTMSGIAGIAGSFLSSKISSPLGRVGGTMLTSFATSGNWNAANKMNLGGVFGSNSALGTLMNGATISNLSDGSFFKKSGDNLISQFLSNAKKLITSYLGTLLQKLNYVVGFNLSATLLNLLSNFNILSTNTVAQLNDVYKPSFSYSYYADMDEQIRKYFQYKGANYQMITRTGDLMEWEQDAYYSTGTMDPSGKDKDVELIRSINDADYDEFSESMNTIRDSVNLNIERADWFTKFNRYRLIHPDSVLSHSKGYVFFTRPDLNIVTDNMACDVGLLFYNMATQHSTLIAELQSSMTGNHQFMPILCNRCTGMEISDESLETKEVNETMTGWRLNYGLNLIKSKSANTVTTSFIDDEQLSIYLMFKLWCEYISAVSRGTMSPKSDYIKTKQLDYANSIYYFLTAEDGESILFWTKYTGCIPTNIPSSDFSDSIDNTIKIPKYSITWQYAFKKDYDPYSLAEFNKLTGDSFEYANMYNSNTTRSSSTLCGAPFVDTNTAGYLFKLRFRPVES